MKAWFGLYLLLLLIPVSASAQGVKVFAATNIPAEGAVLQRLKNTKSLVMFEGGNLAVAADGRITGRLNARIFGDASLRSTAKSYNINANSGSRVFPSPILVTTNTYTSKSTNFYYSNLDKSTTRSVTTDTSTVVRHTSDFVINVSGDYVAKGRAIAEFETFVSVSSGDRSTSSSQNVFLEGGLFSRNGSLVGEFNAGTRLSQ